MKQATRRSVEDVSTEQQSVPSKRSLSDRLFHDRNILRWEGSYFCFDRKAAAKRTGSYEFVQTIKTHDEEFEYTLKVEPDARWGYPNVLAYKVLHAILKKLSSYGYPAPNSVSFSQRDLAACIQRKWSGTTAKQMLAAIKQLRRTTLTATIYDKETKKWVTESFEILIGDIISGRGARSANNITECVVYINPTIVKSLNCRYTFCINHARIEHLEPIAIALYKQLYFKFSNLHSIGRFADKTFTKDYSAICRDWLGGLTVLPYISKIEQEQLGQHLQQLKQVGLLRSYRIEKNKERTGFNIAFVAGASFFFDYEHFYKQRMQPALQFDRAKDEHCVQHPLELVRFFHEKKLGADQGDDFFVSDKERSFAKELLEHYSLSECKELVTFALSQASSTSFDLKQFGGIRLYMREFEATRKTREQLREQKKQQQTKEEAQRRQNAYQLFRRGEVQRIRDTLAEDKLASIEQPIAKEVGQGIGSRLLIKMRVDSVLAERFDVPTYEAWNEQQFSEST